MYICLSNKAKQKPYIMSYSERIEVQLEKGEVIVNDSNPAFTWSTFTRDGLKQIHIYKGEAFEIKKYKTLKSLAVAVGKLLNGSY